MTLAAIAVSRRRGPAMKRQRGFTLMEIIIVVILIAAIAAFAASRIAGGSDRAKVNLARVQVQTLGEKVEQYRMDTGKVPASLDDLATAPAGVSGWLGPYVRQTELEDPWRNPFRFVVPGDGVAFDLRSFGADGRPGGDSVDADIPYTH